MERVREGERVGKTPPPCSSSRRYPSSTRTCYPMQKLPFHGCSRSKCTSSLIREPMPPHEAGIVAPLSPPSPLPFLHIHPQPITSHSHRPHLLRADKYRMGGFPVSTALPMHTPYLSYRTTVPASSQHPSIFPQPPAPTRSNPRRKKKPQKQIHLATHPRPSPRLSSLRPATPPHPLDITHHPTPRPGLTPTRTAREPGGPHRPGAEARPPEP